MQFNSIMFIQRHLTQNCLEVLYRHYQGAPSQILECQGLTTQSWQHFWAIVMATKVSLPLNNLSLSNSQTHLPYPPSPLGSWEVRASPMLTQRKPQRCWATATAMDASLLHNCRCSTSLSEKASCWLQCISSPQRLFQEDAWPLWPQ